MCVTHTNRPTQLPFANARYNGRRERMRMASLAMLLLGPPRLERDGVPLQFDTRKILASPPTWPWPGRSAARG